jgi:glycosyltransferase involved in cell wall biosynthesis
LVGSSFWGEGEISKAIDASSFKDEIIIAGRLDQTELEQIMASAFALAFVSYFEGFGIPLIEAMQCEVPILCSNTSCMPEIAGDAALYFDPFDVNDISAKMLELFQSKHLAQELIAKGNLRKLNFSWDKTADKLWKSIEFTIGQPKS